MTTYLWKEKNKPRYQIDAQQEEDSEVPKLLDSNTTVRSCFATVRFKTIHFYDHCRVRPSTPVLWRTTVATQAFFLYVVRF